MGQLEAQEQRHLSITVQEENEANSLPDVPRRRDYKWWLRMLIYTVFVLAGQAVATLLGRQYYEKGGKSNWLATLVQICGFPIFLPYYCIPAWNKNCPTTTNSTIAVDSKPPSTLVLALIYGVLGTLIAADYYLYSLGISYLPVSTFALISASQLAFNALFSKFLNSQKFTFCIINCLVVLSISSILLVLQGDNADSSKISRSKYIIGFICTVGASAGYALTLSLTQLAFSKVIKKESFRVIMDMTVFQSVIATAIILVGFFASGDWKGITHEMEGFQLGKVAYIMNVTWTAINWQLFQMGVVGLVFEASSLFSNSISAVGLPIVPILAVIFFHEKMDGIKAISLVLAIWGFISYVYQHYLDDCKSKREKKHANDEASKDLPLQTING